MALQALTISKELDMRPIFAAVGVAAVCALFPVVSAEQQPTLTPLNCSPSIHSIANCPVDGCGGVSDALLNRAKNRTDLATSPEAITVQDIKNIAQPSDWLTGQPRDSVSTDEGREVRLMAFLKIVKTETMGETCNCNLHELKDTDLHLVMVASKTDPEKFSVTAEITPRVRRQHHPHWTAAKIGSFHGRFVRLTGLLMFDSAHAHHSHKVNNDDRDHAGHKLNRATNWEVHPVTKFEYCSSTIANCKAGTGWKEVS
jgi:hypothetical protein